MSFRSKDRRPLKQGINAEESRLKRVDQQISLRRQIREENLSKKRNVKGDTAGDAFDASSNLTAAAADSRSTLMRAEINDRLRQLPQMFEAVMSNDPKLQQEAVTAFRKLLSIERSPPIEEVIQCGVVPRLVHFLTCTDNPPLQFEAAWALTNVASGTTKHTRVVIDCGAVDIFVLLLKSPNEEVREQAVWALGNIAGDSAGCRDLVLAKGALHPLLQLCEPTAKVTMLRNATWTLSNFCRGKPQPNFEDVSPALPVLANIIRNIDDTEVLTDACWALSYLSDDTGSANAKIQAVIQAGVTQKLVELLMHPSANVKTPALRTVGNIVTGDDLQTQQIISMSALPCLLALLANPKKGIRKEACWTISNITAGNTEQIQAVIDANILGPLVSILSTEEFDIKKEAAWAISNATSGGDPRQIRQLVEAGVIKPMCDLLRCPDARIIMVALEGLENILRVGKHDAMATNGVNRYAKMVEMERGLDGLEALQQHDNDDLYLKAAAVIRDYWGSDEELQDALPALVPDQQGGFAAFPNQQQQQQHQQQTQQQQQQQPQQGGFRF